MRGELSDQEWTAIKPMLPNELRGMPRVNNLRVLNGICWVLRPGAIAFIRLASIRIWLRAYYSTHY
jgi:hypothetical protein